MSSLYFFDANCADLDQEPVRIKIQKRYAKPCCLNRHKIVSISPNQHFSQAGQMIIKLFLHCSAIISWWCHSFSESVIQSPLIVSIKCCNLCISYISQAACLDSSFVYLKTICVSTLEYLTNLFYNLITFLCCRSGWLRTRCWCSREAPLLTEMVLTTRGGQLMTLRPLTVSQSYLQLTLTRTVWTSGWGCP